MDNYTGSLVELSIFKHYLCQTSKAFRGESLMF